MEKIDSFGNALFMNKTYSNALKMLKAKNQLFSDFENFNADNLSLVKI